MWLCRGCRDEERRVQDKTQFRKERKNEKRRVIKRGGRENPWNL